MRVIAGELGGRRLRSHERPGLRPTTDRVRESMFAMITARLDLDGVDVLDLYAGTGALGIEALSRGAASCRFVESDHRTAGLIRQNLSELGLDDRARITVRDALLALQDFEAQRFDLVLADPPYAAPVFQRLPELVRPVLKPGGLFVLEHPAHEAPAARGFIGVGQRTFGETGVAIFRREGTESSPDAFSAPSL